jgi:hypothetical protein
MTHCVLRMFKGCVYLAGRGSLEELCEWVSPDDGERPAPAAYRKASRANREKFFAQMEDRAHALARASLAFLKNISMPPAATWKSDGGVCLPLLQERARLSGRNSRLRCLYAHTSGLDPRRWQV